MLKFSAFFNRRIIIGTTESEVNEFMIIGLGMGILSMAFLAAILICHRKRKRKNHTEHPMLPSHAHFHTCESIGERFATSSSMDSVRVNTSAAHEYRIIAITRSILTYLHFAPFFSGMTIEIVNECECHLPAAKILKKNKLMLILNTYTNYYRVQYIFGCSFFSKKEALFSMISG